MRAWRGVALEQTIFSRTPGVLGQAPWLRSLARHPTFFLGPATCKLVMAHAAALAVLQMNYSNVRHHMVTAQCFRGHSSVIQFTRLPEFLVAGVGASSVFDNVPSHRERDLALRHFTQLSGYSFCGRATTHIMRSDTQFEKHTAASQWCDAPNVCRVFSGHHLSLNRQLLSFEETYIDR